jgi:hypothetical protein
MVIMVLTVNPGKTVITGGTVKTLTNSKNGYKRLYRYKWCKRLTMVLTVNPGKTVIAEYNNKRL